MSSAPVGSSARITEGLPDSARESQRVLLLTTRQFVRPWSGRFFHADNFQRSRRVPVPFASRNTAIDERQFYIAQRGLAREQIVLLKNETQLLRARRRQFHVIQLRNLKPSSVYVPASAYRDSQSNSSACSCRCRSVP